MLVRILRLPTRRPRATLALLALLVALGAAGVALRGVRMELGVEQFVAHDDPLFQRTETLGQRFGRDDNTVFVFATRAAWFTPEGARLALDLSDALARSELVKEVLGPATATLIRDRGRDVYVGPILTLERLATLTPADLLAIEAHLRREPAYAGRVISPDGKTLAFAVRIDDAHYGGRHHRAVVGHVEQALAAFAGQATFLVTGGPPTQLAYQRFLAADTTAFVLLTSAILAAALAITFRSVQGVVLPLAAVGLSLVFTAMFLSLSGCAVNLLSSAIPVLVLVTGISDAIHLLTRYAEELAGGLDRHAALERAVTVTAHACLLTSITTSVGFFVLPATGIPMLADMGLVTGAGVVIAYLVSLSLIPALAALMPPPRPLPPAADSALLGRLGEWVMDRPKRVSGALVAVLALLVCLGGPRLRVESRVVDDLPPDHPVVQTRAAVEERMGGNYPLTLLIHPTPPVGDPTADPDLLARVARFEALLQEQPPEEPPYLSHAVSAADLLSLGARSLGGTGLPTTVNGLEQVKLLLGAEPLDPLVDRVEGSLRVPLRVYDRGTQATFAFLARAQAAFDQTVGERGRLEVSGFTYLAHRTHREIVWSSMTSFTLDFLIVAALVAFLFRSLRLTLLALAPNLFPLVCTVAFMGLAGIDLRISSAIVFSVVFGIAVDDTVHFLARFHEERAAADGPRQATRRTLRTTGRAMLFMAFVLATGFGVLMFSAFTPNRVLGLLMAVTVASGIVGDLVLLPALLVLGDRREAKA
ncbi:MAG: RND family transporter [Planctomycetota bacterium]